MREKLLPLVGRRARFAAKFKRYGKKGLWGTRTMLLTDITLDGRPVADDVWMAVGKRFRLDLVEGDALMFDARVTRYEKGYRGGWDPQTETDCRLSYPTRVERVWQAAPKWTLLPYMRSGRQEAAG